MNHVALETEQCNGSAERNERRELARFDRDYRISESSLKYAFIWFQSAVELFSPPESKWVR